LNCRDQYLIFLTDNGESPVLLSSLVRIVSSLRYRGNRG
jgi:hypothetical protein